MRSSKLNINWINFHEFIFLFIIYLFIYLSICRTRSTKIWRAINENGATSVQTVNVHHNVNIIINFDGFRFIGPDLPLHFPVVWSIIAFVDMMVPNLQQKSDIISHIKTREAITYHTSLQWNSVRFSQIQWNPVKWIINYKFCKILTNSVQFSQILYYFHKFRKIFANSVKSCKTL